MNNLNELNIFDYPSQWHKFRLRFAVDYQKGKNPKEVDVQQDGQHIYLSMDYLRGNNDQITYINDSTDYIKVSDEDILLLWDGSNAGEFVRSRQGILSSTMAVLLFKNTNISKYYFWYLAKTIEPTIRAFTVGMGIPHVNRDILNNIIIGIPDYIIQKAIAEFLDYKTAQIDKLIEEKEKLLKLLEEKRIAIITQAVTKGLDPNVKMKPSGIDWLGDIPEHWEIVKLKRLIKKKKDAIKTGPFGSQLISSEMIGGEIKVYNQRNVLDNSFSTGDDLISYDKFEELKAFETFPGDILITTRGTIGRCAILPQNAERGILHPCLMRIQVDSKINPEYLLNLFQNSNMLLEQILLNNNATTIPVIYSDTLKELILPLPPIEEQLKILFFISSELTKLRELELAIKGAIIILKEYRISLITSAVTGKIDVRDFKPGEKHEKVY
jgi:type I restriction enzyme S subunit